MGFGRIPLVTGLYTQSILAITQFSRKAKGNRVWKVCYNCVVPVNDISFYFDLLNLDASKKQQTGTVRKIPNVLPSGVSIFQVHDF